ncbi:hypothetical protein KI387_037160, partial [Taxus chinensis]
TAVAVSRAMELSIGITPDVKGVLGTGVLEENGANASSFGTAVAVSRAMELSI